MSSRRSAPRGPASPSLNSSSSVAGDMSDASSDSEPESERNHALAHSNTNNNNNTARKDGGMERGGGGGNNTARGGGGGGSDDDGAGSSTDSPSNPYSFVPPTGPRDPARDEVEELLQRLKRAQRGVKEKRGGCNTALEEMKASIKKLRKDTDELLKQQQTNLSTIGRKLT